MDKRELAYRFRSALGFTTDGRPGEKLEPIDKLLAKLEEMKIPLLRVGYTSYGGTADGKYLKLHLKLLKGETSARILYFNRDQKLIKVG